MVLLLLLSWCLLNENILLRNKLLVELLLVLIVLLHLIELLVLNEVMLLLLFNHWENVLLNLILLIEQKMLVAVII